MHSKELDDLEPFDKLWELPQEVPDLGKHGAEEVILYLSRNGAPEIRVNGQRATLFWPGDRISIVRQDQRRVLAFEVTGGDFTGHIMPASRSKREPMNLSHFVIILKTLRRPSQCTVTVRLQVDR